MVRILIALFLLLSLSGCSTMNSDGTRKPGLLAHIGKAMQTTAQPIIDSNDKNCSGTINNYGGNTDYINMNCQ